MDPGHPGALRGLRVLDLSRMVAAPYTAMALGEMGADVIKVERAGVGDDTRQFGPFTDDGRSPYFTAYNRNKRSIALDLTTPADAEALRELVDGWADVVIENFKDGTLERWGIPLVEMRARKPWLITATVRGYPEGDSRPGYDFIMQAATGLMALTGEPDGGPMRVGIPISDLLAGQFLLSGVLAAVVERDRSGVGQHVSVSLYEAQAAAMGHAAQQYLELSQEPPRVGNGNAVAGPYGVYPTATTAVAVCCGADRQFEKMARALGREEWLADPRFGSNSLRAQHSEALDQLVVEEFAGRSSEEVLELLRQAGMPSGPVQTLAEMLDEDDAARRVKSAVRAEDGRMEPAVALPWSFSRTPAAPSRAAPRLGEDTAEVLPALGREPHLQPDHTNDARGSERQKELT